jgi:hypothetical protein
MYEDVAAYSMVLKQQVIQVAMKTIKISVRSGSPYMGFELGTNLNVGHMLYCSTSMFRNKT